MATNSDDPPGERYDEPWRTRVAAELEAYRAEQQRLWGGIDELTLARYESGASPPEEQSRVEQALRDHPALRECLEFSRELTEEWQAAHVPQGPGERPDDRREANASTPVLVGPVTIHVGDVDQVIPIPRRPAPKPILRWLAVAAAVLALVGLTYRFAWRRDGPGSLPEVAKKDTPIPTPEKPNILVENRKAATDHGNANFAEALSALEKRASAGIDPKAFREEYDRFLKDYPDHRAEIERNPRLASALARSAPAVIVKKSDREPSSPVIVSARDALLARIAEHGGKPLKVREARVRELREAVVRYQKEHPDQHIPGMEAFIAATEPTPHNELLYAEARAKELMAAPNESADVRELRNTILTLRLRDDTRPLALQSLPLAEFLKLKRIKDPAAVEAELKTQVVALTEHFPNRKERGPLLFCVLPPGLRDEGVRLYQDIQTYARSGGTQLDPILLDYLTRTRRPTDTLGMIIPVYWGNLDQMRDQEAKDMLAQWASIKAVAAQGVRVKVVNRLQTSLAKQNGDTYQLLAEAKSLNIQVYAYVHAGRGNQRLENAKAGISRWHELYKGMFSGIYLDNVPFNEVGSATDFAALYDHVLKQDKNWQVIAGTLKPCDEAYLPPATSPRAPGIVCVDTDMPAPKAKGWEAKYDPDRFAVMLHRANSMQSWEEILFQAAADHYGWIYVTDPARGVGSLAFPSYFPEEVAAIARLNAAITGKDDGTARKNQTRKSQARKQKGQR